MSTDMRILYDGWLMARQPNSPAGLHLWSLLVSCPEGFQPAVALPATISAPLPRDTQAVIQPVQNSAWGRLVWEQRLLPALARRVGAGIIHAASQSAPLLPGVPVIVSNADFETGASLRPMSFSDRLYAALGAGGLARVRAILQPEDIALQTGRQVQRVKPFTFLRLADPSNQLIELKTRSLLEDGDRFVLYHGPGELPDLHRLISTWSWASRPLSEPASLVLAGLSHLPDGLILKLMRQYEVTENVIVLPDLSPEGIAGLYRDCCALFHPAPLTPWGEPLRSALAAGKPVVAALTRGTEALVGPAAYLASSDDNRALGAALISVLVDQGLADQLAQAAWQQATPWREVTPSQALAPVYQGFARLT